MKILLLKNNVLDNTTLTHGILLAQQWCQTIGLTLDFSYEDTSVQFKSVPLNTDVVQGGYTVDSAQIFQEGIKLGQADVYLLVYDWTKITPQPTNPSDSGRAMSIPCQWYNVYPEVFAQFFLHELCHYYFALTGKTDITHLLVSGTLQAQYPQLYAQFNEKQPQDYYLYLLKQFVPQTPTLPVVTITRTQTDTKQTLGILRTDDGQFGCNTLELASRNNQVNISDIPVGTYTCEWHFKWNSLAYHYEVMGVPNRSGIFIHPGNFFFNSRGCILLGSLPKDINKDGELDLVNSRAIVSAFEAKMGKRSFTLVIS